MANQLEPHESEPFLSPEEIAQRLRKEFKYCTIDREAGIDHVGDVLAALVRMKAPAEMINKVAAGRDRSIKITIGDDDPSEDACLSFTVQPDDGIFIGYHSGQHEAAASSLLERCAAALNYQVKLV